MTREDQTDNIIPDRKDDPGFNPEDYKQDLGVETLSDEEIEMLRALWHIMSVMVDIGWGVESVQLLLPELFTEASKQNSSLPLIPACDTSDSDICDNDQRKEGQDD